MKCIIIFVVLAQVSFLLNGCESFYYRTPIKGSDKFPRPESHEKVSHPYPIPFEEYYQNKGLNFFAFGDWGEQKPESGQFQVAKALQDWANENTSFIVNVGDNFYQENENLPFNDKTDHESVLSINDPKWHTYWLNVYNGTLKKIYWYMVAGNHDWYRTKDQLISAKDADWIFVVGHHPLVGACQTKKASAYKMHRFPPLFNKYNVSAYIGGHVHDIEFSAANRTTNVTYFGVGGGGAAGSDTCGNTTWAAPFTFGFLHINIPNDGDTLYFDYIEANETDKPSRISYSGIVHSRKWHEKY
ncbi:24450_t:CDS:2 [Dentiscutata erythropus]|uniref:24450_t:CDS:1 n=1 Tax=Dentiscutata erythropus TaxID=1348616 RepID=A0A9N9N6L7_9GLOM|nr:24450_t:CDS:2 [Dentiscutata erythropus]